MSKTFNLGVLKRFLEQVDAPPPPPVVVNVDLSAFARILGETQLKIKNGVTPLPG